MKSGTIRCLRHRHCFVIRLAMAIEFRPDRSSDEGFGTICESEHDGRKVALPPHPMM